jgi:tetratricopeptide (TPR) repeat protein
LRKIAYQYKANEHVEKAESEMNKALSILDSLATSSKNTSIREKCYLDIGTIYFRFFYDIDKALNYFSLFLQKFPKSRFKEEAMIAVGDLYVTRGDIESAKRTYQKAIKGNGSPLSSFKLAELEFYQGHFQSALNKYSQILSKSALNDSLTNNILSRKLLINSFIEDSVSLRKYSLAELLIFQNKLSEATGLLLELVNQKIRISITAGRRAGEIFIKMKKIADAKNLLENLMKEYQESEYLDEIIFLLAYCEKKSGDLNRALELYKLLLTNHPDSLHTQEARQNARLLSDKLEQKNI